MEERNKYIEADGLFWESDTHEWFHDKMTTNHAQKDDLHNISLENIFAFVLRNKKTGEYDRVLFDANKKEIIFDTKRLEDIGAHIDMLKTKKYFEANGI